jgi:hypothetical protein
MSTTIEYRTADKSEWGPGEWMNEPDKVQWIDAETGLDCLAVRAGDMGHWCGYVGVPETHPLFGKDYGQCPAAPPCGEPWCGHTPGSLLRAHGGITFADFCTEPTLELFEQMRARRAEYQAQAAKYPRGEAARWIKEWGTLLDDYAAWEARAIARFICHVPAEGRPERVWWFGFDCAHHGDFSPGLASRLSMGRTYETYKMLDYVRDNCAALARQLAALTNTSEG